MPDAQSRRFYIVRQLQVAGKLPAKVAGNHLLLSVTSGSERCRSGGEIPGARLYEREGAERRSRGVEGSGIRDELIYTLRMQGMRWRAIVLGSLLLISICSRGGQDVQSPQPENPKPPVKTEQRGRILGIGC